MVHIIISVLSFFIFGFFRDVNFTYLIGIYFDRGKVQMFVYRKKTL